jgi:hypothetical protein
VKTIGRMTLAAGLMLALVSGCGGDGRPKLYQVEGAVTINGEPLEGAHVSFQPLPDGQIQRPSTAITDAQGKFVLGTYAEKDGAPKGKYKVAIQKREMMGDLPANYNFEEPEATPIRYQWITPREAADPETSGLEAEVTSSGLTPPVFELTGQPEIETVGGGGGNVP